MPLRPTVESMDSSPEDSVVLLDPHYWEEHAWQFASLLQTGIRGPIGDPRGRHPDLVATIAAPEYWSRHVSELSDALLHGDRRCAPCRTEVAGALSSDSSGRLTMTVEEVARALGISRAFAYEAVHRGEIPHIRIGRRMLVPRAALARVLAAVELPDEA
jgi:excisionase family DNA binding protein